MAKLNIDFVLIDESVLVFGFRCLMVGAELESFKANPVMLCQHIRPDDATKDEIRLPIGKWWDIRVEGDKLKAKPDFDDKDTFAMEVQGKVERGYMSGASVWLEPKTASDDKSLKIEGQNLPTVTKWGVLEASIVDIPNCKNALAIRSQDGTKLTLNANNIESDKLKSYLLGLERTVSSKPITDITTIDNPPVKKETSKELRLKQLMETPYDDLLLNDELEELKSLDLSSYFQKFRTAFGYPCSEERISQLTEKQGDMNRLSIDIDTKKLMEKSWDTLWKTGESEVLYNNYKEGFFKKYLEGNGKKHPLDKS